MPQVIIRSEKLHRQLKVVAAKNGLTLGELVQYFAQTGLDLNLLELSSDEISRLTKQTKYVKKS